MGVLGVVLVDGFGGTSKLPTLPPPYCSGNHQVLPHTYQYQLYPFLPIYIDLLTYQYQCCPPPYCSGNHQVLLSKRVNPSSCLTSLQTSISSNNNPSSNTPMLPPSSLPAYIYRPSTIPMLRWQLSGNGGSLGRREAMSITAVLPGLYR